MALSKLSFTSNLTWALTKANSSGFGSTTQGPDSIFFNANTASLTTFNQIYVATFTVAASANQDVDCSSLTNLVGETFGFGHALALMVIPNGSEVTVKPGASNALQWFFGGTAQSVVVPDGGFLCFSGKPTGTGQVVDSSHKNLRFTNSGATSLTLDIAILGGTS